jgi:hypothetical protein
MVSLNEEVGIYDKHRTNAESPPAAGTPGGAVQHRTGRLKARNECGKRAGDGHGEVRVAIVLHKDDLAEIAKRGYEGAASNAPKLQAEAVASSSRIRFGADITLSPPCLWRHHIDVTPSRQSL